MILSGISTITSSKKEPTATGIPAACVAANTASPHTFPVVPPQKMQFNGVEMSTATKPATIAVKNAPENFSILPSLAITPTARPINKLVRAYTKVIESPVVKP